jgi:4-hydroxyphenylpyruvate dioxygenase
MVSSNSSVVAAKNQGSSEVVLAPTFSPPEIDSWQIKGIDYIEFYVGNAFQAAHFYRTGFGFTPIAYGGPETGLSERTSWVMKQNNIYLVLTSALNAHHPIAHQVAKHGDGVKDIALRVDNVVAAFTQLTQRGALPILEPEIQEDEQGKFIKATIRAFGDTVHSLIERHNYQGTFAPDYQKVHNPPPAQSIGITDIDHIAICVEAGKLEEYCDFYHRVIGFHESYRMNFITEKSGMNSRVMESDTGIVKLPICEPVVAKCQSQIEEFLRYYGDSGVQHLAFLSDNIIQTVQDLQNNGIEFASHPDTYYESLKSRLGQIDEDIDVLRELQILADLDKDGYLLQLFTKIVQDRPTFFLEIIQRHGTNNFGQGNVKALFEAVQRQQQQRGHL